MPFCNSHGLYFAKIDGHWTLVNVGADGARATKPRPPGNIEDRLNVKPRKSTPKS